MEVILEFLRLFREALDITEKDRHLPFVGHKRHMGVLACQAFHHLGREERAELRLLFLQRPHLADGTDEVGHQFGESQVTSKFFLVDISVGNPGHIQAPAATRG